MQKYSRISLRNYGFSVEIFLAVPCINVQPNSMTKIRYSAMLVTLLENICTKARFPLPKLTARVNGPS